MGMRNFVPCRKKRDPFFDVLKFVAIGLVVYGHVTERFGCEVLRPYDGNFIVGMNMPLFFAISGYFSVRIVDGRDWRMLLTRMRGYLWPNFSFNALLCGSTVCLAKSFCAVGGVWGVVQWLFFRSWFVWSLASILGIAFVCRQVSAGRRFYMALAVAYAVLLLLPDVWLVSWTRAMFPNFVFGLLVLRTWPLWKRTSVGLTCLALFLVGVFVQGSIHQNGMSFYHVGSGWADLIASPRMAGLAVLRFANGIVGTLGVMWVVREIIRRVRWTECLAPLGTTTLGVYLLHEWFLNYIRPGGFYWTLFVTVVLFLGCHLIVVLTRQVALLRRWLWGEWGNQGGA